MFLLPDRLQLIHRLSDWGEAKEVLPENRLLKMLFMVCSAINMKPELDYEREEETIYNSTKNLSIDMEVEDTGSLEGLKHRLEREQFDVIHLSGLIAVDKNGQPYFLMENETGYPHKIYPEELLEDALMENPPRLLVLSWCYTGDTPDNGAAVSFVRKLMEKNRIPAVLVWEYLEEAESALHAEKMIYPSLCRGKSITDALQSARELMKKLRSRPNAPWSRMRLFSTGIPLGAIVKENRQRLAEPKSIMYTYLEQSHVRVLKKGFVGRRRQLQTCLDVLRNHDDKIGVIINGAGGLGKSCLAGKICERFPGHTLIIIQGKLDAITLEIALQQAFTVAQDKEAQQILEIGKELTLRLADLCVTVFKKKNYLLLLDDFEQNLEGTAADNTALLLPEAAELMKELLHWLPSSGKMTQLIITSRHSFSLTEEACDQVKEKLESIILTSFRVHEQYKKARELKNIISYPDQEIRQQLLAGGLGNPWLMEQVNVLVGKMRNEKVPRLLKAIEHKQEELIRDHVLRELLRCGGDELTRFLQHFSIYRLPVLEQGVETVVKNAGLKERQALLENGIDLNLIEFDQNRQTYRLTPLLREELLAGLKKTRQSHKPAFAYYKELCQTPEKFDPIMTEEFIFHALGCGEERVVSEQGGRLVKYLRERLALKESKRVGVWILEGKKQELSSEYDAFLLNETAFTLKILEEYETAIRYYQKALTINRSVFGEFHHSVARGFNYLGSAYGVLEGPKKAIEYYRQGLDIVNRKDLSKKHPILTGEILNNLGAALYDTGDVREAINYYKKAQAIWEKFYGEDHPNVAVTLTNLGKVWNNSGDHHKAAECFNKALSIDLAAYGKNHPEVAGDFNNLGAVYSDQGNYDKAIGFYNNSLSIWEKIYGQRHKNTVAVLANLGKAYLSLEQKEIAKEYFSRAYTIFEDIFGADHRYTKSLSKFLI
jgi:tetratricopeptide (TPR) repeat protein